MIIFADLLSSMEQKTSSNIYKASSAAHPSGCAALFFSENKVDTKLLQWYN